MIEVIITQLDRADLFDFADRTFLSVIREDAMIVAEDRASWHIPPADTLFVQRKISGTALLCARLEAQVEIRAMVDAYRVAKQPESAAE